MKIRAFSPEVEILPPGGVFPFPRSTFFLGRPAKQVVFSVSDSQTIFVARFVQLPWAPSGPSRRPIVPHAGELGMLVQACAIRAG